LYAFLIIGWIIGMIVYIALNKADRYNHRKYFNVKNNIKKFKNIQDEINGVQRNPFK
jgi:hypothetical protein